MEDHSACWRLVRRRSPRSARQRANRRGGVESVGMGEVFVISGQSNSINYGDEAQRIAQE
jgi:hypothetical protein